MASGQLCPVRVVLPGPVNRPACLCDRRGVCRDLPADASAQQFGDHRLCLWLGVDSVSTRRADGLDPWWQ